MNFLMLYLSNNLEFFFLSKIFESDKLKLKQQNKTKQNKTKQNSKFTEDGWREILIDIDEDPTQYISF